MVLSAETTVKHTNCNKRNAKMKHTQIRQGDVLVKRIQPINISTEAPRENDKIVLAHGEVTGHAHAIAARGRKSTESTVTRQDAPLVVSTLEIAEALAELQHEEHATAKLEQGHFEVIRQREYSPAAIRNVAD